MTAGVVGPANDEPALGVSGLACVAGVRTLFEQVAFDVHGGRCVVLTGPNGVGKSTLIRAVAGLVTPAAGEVRWRGAARRRHDPAWHASIVYQGHLNAWKEVWTVGENLASIARLDGGDDAPALAAALERVGLQRQRSLPFMRLSAGQRRRLGLARLVLSRRPLWLLDEPTTALDGDGQALFAALLDEHLGHGGCALIATHLRLATTSEPREIALTRPARRER